MFENCGKLVSLDISNFVTSNVDDMSNLFKNCSSLESLKINFDTKKVKTMHNMFSTCTKLTSLDITSFNTAVCTNFTKMFENDNGLKLSINSKICQNLKEQLPSFLEIHDINQY
jgi:surface protein